MGSDELACSAATRRTLSTMTIVVTIRWGERSAGGVVKAGGGGWYLYLRVPGRPNLMFIDPVTGDAVSSDGWNPRRVYRRVCEMRARNAQRRGAGA